ncbi:MAG: malate dehydrogenase [Candidatus Marsarchaeota archaeon]|nr:malate dehydrogenase [Candidatus Marsarchaeota archaeon]MCL5115272.1 malate dehydrogenase [Candidatus Marsarchaeota archaeon]
MRKKVSIIGAGRVGSTACQLLAYRDVCDIVIWNRTEGTAKGIALDLIESAPLEGFDTNITGTSNFDDINGSEIVVITAGMPRKEGMSRDDLLNTNAEIVKGICLQVKNQAPESKVIVLTNPLDEMVHLAKRITGFPRERVVGMAGILDSARFRAFIAKELGVSVESVSAMVLGGHGDFMVPLPANSTVNGTPITELMPKEKIDQLMQRTRDGGAEIIKLEKESSAFYAPASSLLRMITAVLEDKKEVLPCSAFLNGEYNISGIFMGVPVVLGSNGMERIIELKLSDEEAAALKTSADKVRELTSHIDAML